MVDCTGLENRRTERYRGFESLPLRKKKEAKASFFALEGMRTPEWGFVIDEVGSPAKSGGRQNLIPKNQNRFV